MDPINELRLHNEIVALEAFALPNIRDLVSRILPGIVNNFNSFVGGLSASDTGIPLSSKNRDFLKFIDKHRYVDLAPITSYVPEGLNVPYLDFAVHLNGAVDYVLPLPETLNKFSTFLAVLLTNRDEQMSTKDKHAEYQKYEQDRLLLIKDIGRCFKPGSTVAEVSYGAVVKRNSDWEHVLGYTEYFAAKINEINRKQLNDKVKEIAGYLDKLLEQHKKGNLSNVTPEVFTELSYGTYQMARALEFFSVVYFRVLGFNESVNKTIANVMTVME